MVSLNSFASRHSSTRLFISRELCCFLGNITEKNPRGGSKTRFSVQSVSEKRIRNLSSPRSRLSPRFAVTIAVRSSTRSLTNNLFNSTHDTDSFSRTSTYRSTKRVQRGGLRFKRVGNSRAKRPLRIWYYFGSTCEWHGTKSKRSRARSFNPPLRNTVVTFKRW